MSLRDAPEFDAEEYRSPAEFGGTGVPLMGPGFFKGAILLAICVIAAVRLSDQGALGTVALANAVTHFISGFAWTIRSAVSVQKHKVKLVGIMLWLVTVIVGVLLLVLSFFI
jgi:hypothetical protein